MKRRPVRVYLEAVKNDGTVQRVISNTKRRFLSRLQALPAKEIRFYRCRITYGIGLYNEFERTTKKDVIEAYRIFTAADEVDFIRKYNNG